MHKALRRQPWTCARCLRKQQRANSTAAGIAVNDDNNFQSTYLHSTPSTRTKGDNALLRDVFNRKALSQATDTRRSGLIGNSLLTTPKGFKKFAETSVLQCKRLVERTLAASTAEEYKAIPKDLDRLSDLLCRVIDLSDFIRSIHPSADVAAAASASYSLMFQYMNELNTTTGLNAQLKKAWDIPEVRSQWNEEERMVAMLLMRDFAKSGIHLPEKQRQQFVSLSNDIVQLGNDFVNQMDHAKDYVSFSAKQLDGLDPTLIQGLKHHERAQIPVSSRFSKMVLHSAKDPVTRREMYLAERSASKKTVSTLEQLLLRRAQLAKLTGFDNFAQMALIEKMAKTPEAVNNFLESINANNKLHVQKELAPLLDIKRKLDQGAESLDPWDHNYLLSKLDQMEGASGPRTSKSRLQESARSYFAIGHVMQGLSSLFESLYGVRFVPKETAQGEIWHTDVRRLDVYTDKQEHIATIYCDLFSRPGKQAHPAHFTLLCSREISNEEIRDCAERNEPLNNGMPTLSSTSGSQGETKHHQIPIIALVCGFPHSSAANEPALLSQYNLISLFHEMGHAIHSILGRTSLQGISGTRVATDFSELPSVLMESFATDPSVLKLFARHHQTDEAMPDDLIRILASSTAKDSFRQGAFSNESQILMSILDQIYHGDGPVQALRSGRYDSTAVYYDVWNQHGSMPEPWGTSWQGFFGHLHGYGASYYSYLFDTAIARRVWSRVFRSGEGAGAIDRNAGERFKEEVLRWGGGRDPWLCLEGLLGEGRGVLAEGGEEAMLEVGRWGVGVGGVGEVE
ncbi:Mitochondrial intermediate peptidase [Cladophialophora chaetospira]|uniref:Mitochondrial intermediate peptidase n=1 Tax=Cladophialophora chaetospira TaxID=386627 RepID=A0AA38X8C5_9EURO|nr:Mitochondrial intermediate peptidase [Cladophialophora chaetospira]